MQRDKRLCTVLWTPLTLNPTFQPIAVGEHEGVEMTVVGEWVTTLED